MQDTPLILNIGWLVIHHEPSAFEEIIHAHLLTEKDLYLADLIDTLDLDFRLLHL